MVMRAASWVLILAAATWIASAAAETPSQARAPASQNPPRLVVNGRMVQTDIAPRIIQGTTLVPIRFIAQALGANLTWQPAGREAVIDYEGQRVVVQAGAETLVAGNRSIRTHVPVQVIQGRTMVPLRVVAEAFGADVRWDPQARTIYIRTVDQPAAPASPQELPQPTPAAQIQQSVEVGLSTPQTEYPAGAPIELTLSIRNTGDETVRLQMRTGQLFDFIVQRDGQEVWRWSQGRAFTQALTQLVLLPNEMRGFTVRWDGTDNSGARVPPGTYTLIGRVTHALEVPLQDTREIRITAAP